MIGRARHGKGSGAIAAQARGPAHVRHRLELDTNGELPEQPFLRLLSEQLDAGEAEAVLNTAISWARHGEVFEYDFHTGLLRLPTGEAEAGDEAV